jgi:hypothetical protein
MDTTDDGYATLNATFPSWLADWARDLANERQRYSFAGCDVFSGRAVVAVRSEPGAGLLVVITGGKGRFAPRSVFWAARTGDRPVDRMPADTATDRAADPRIGRYRLRPDVREPDGSNR